MQKIKEDIKNHDFAQVYLLYGPEVYLRRTAKQKLREAITGDDTMNYTYREGRDISITEVKDAADTMPFFAEKRLIILENTGWLSKGGEAMAEYLDHMPETTCLIFVENDIDKRCRLYKKINQIGYCAEFARLSEDMIRKYVLQSFRSAGLKTTGGAMDLFIERCGDDLDSITGEIEKLTAYCRDKEGITEEDVEKLTSVTLNERLFDMLNAIALGRQQDALTLYYDLLALKEPAMKILALLTQQFNRLLQIKELQRMRESSAEIAEAIKIKPFAVKKYIHNSSRFSEDELKIIMKKLADNDAAIKSGNIKDSLALELLIVELSGRKFLTPEPQNGAPE